MNWRTARIGLAAVAATVAGACESDQSSHEGAATVVYVVDGDTIDVRIDGRTERVRLIGIDTPETKKPNTPIECFGPEASEFTMALLPEGTDVRIERDVVGRDDYGRLLGYVYLTAPAAAPSTTHGSAASVSPSASGGDEELFVNLEIIRRGYATPLTIEPNSVYADAFAGAASAAEAEDLGLWAECSS